MVSEADVVSAYRLILGREPEDPRMVANMARQHSTLKELRASFMASPEFVEKLGRPLARAYDASGTKGLIWPAIKVEAAVDPEILQRMVKRIEGEFLELGAREPHWSVLTEDRFKSDRIGETEADFFESGRMPVDDLEIAAARSGLNLSGRRSCFELGCGLGRSTIWLARRFDRVTGGDISEVHLEHARATARRFGLPDISFVLLNEIGGYAKLEPFDVFFSMIVLQHNPPPLMAFILQTLLRKLAPGGVAYFQIPTYIVNYSFSAADYLAAEHPAGDVEVHCLPQAALFDIIERAGCRILEIREDGAIGSLAISNRLLLEKARG